MKIIGIVTWYGSLNFGTSLQSYALQHIVSSMGYDAYLMPRRDYGSVLKGFVRWLLLHSGIGTLLSLIKDLLADNKQQKKLSKFIKNKYIVANPCTRKEYDELIRKTDVFLTGSDQIWNVSYKFDPFYFLDFAADKKRVAYASSIGTSTIDEGYKERVKNLLKRFSHIGVREETAVNLLKGILPDKEIVQVLDPTFLLTKEEWNDFASEAEIGKKPQNPYIFCYLIGARAEYSQQVKDIAQKTGCSNVIMIPPAEHPDWHLEGTVSYIEAAPLEFVHLLANADFVITDSFHATALSINLQKNFVEFMRFNNDDTNSQNSRIFNVLEHYGLGDRIYSKDMNLNAIDFEKVQLTLDADRKRSIEYLLDAIEN